jgi:hypothetical protein
MNRLLFDALLGDKGGLPDTVTVEGQAYPIYTDFRHWCRVEHQMHNPALAEDVKAQYLLQSFTPSVLTGTGAPGGAWHRFPFDLDAAGAALLNFYKLGGCDWEPPGAQTGGKRQARLYDFVYDIGAIYADFCAVYGMDLRTEGLHWWRFRALFDGLPEGSAMRALMQARGMELKKPTAKQRQQHEAIQLPEAIRWYADGQGERTNNSDLTAWVLAAKKRKEADAVRAHK